MNGKTRFINVINLEAVDRPPLFDDGIRKEVIRKWHAEGLGKTDNLDSKFIFDQRIEIEPNLEPIPAPTRWPTTIAGLRKLADRLDPTNSRRLPDGWSEKLEEWKTCDCPLILRIHRGFF